MHKFADIYYKGDDELKRVIIGLLSGLLLFSTNQNNNVAANIDVKKQMIIVFEDNVSGQEMDDILLDVGGEVSETYAEVGIAKVEVTVDSIAELMDSSSVKYIEEDIIIKQSAQIEDYGIKTTNISAAWDSGLSGKAIKIAVIDSGIASHNDLVIVGGVSTVDYTSSYNDDHGHGTHVAGIIGARNNSYGVKGVAFESDIYAVKAFNQNGEALLSDIIEGINWSIVNDMDIINLSSGTQTASTAFRTVIDKAYENGLLVVAAAGNDGTSDGSGDTVDFPARYDSVIGVSAVDVNSNRAEFSSTGPTVEVAAPGVRVLSTYIGNQYAYISGTSMAAPFVTGELALLKQAYPNLTNKELRKALIEHTLDLGVIGRDTFYGYGLIQASSFLDPIEYESENPVVKIEIDKADILGKPGDFINVLVYAIYKNGESKNVTDEAEWSSDNTGVATVSKGVVELINYGSTTLKVLFEGKTSTIIVNIPEPLEKPIGSNFKDVTSFFAPSVDYLVRHQITRGLNETEFGVSKNILRADAAIWLAKELKLNTNSAPSSGFLDVPDRAVTSVNALKAAGIIGGKSNTRFGAGDSLTRGEVAIILQRAYELSSTSNISIFTDVSPRYKDAVNALVENKITDGLTSTKFGVTSNITRGQLAVFMYRLSPENDGK